MAKTGEIKNFVITEESGIAKGIRRIVALTGHEAAQVEREASRLQTELEGIERLNGKGKETAMKQYTVVYTLFFRVRTDLLTYRNRPLVRLIYRSYVKRI